MPCHASTSWSGCMVSNFCCSSSDCTAAKPVFKKYSEHALKMPDTCLQKYTTTTTHHSGAAVYDAIGMGHCGIKPGCHRHACNTATSTAVPRCMVSLCKPAQHCTACMPAGTAVVRKATGLRRMLRAAPIRVLSRSPCTDLWTIEYLHSAVMLPALHRLLNISAACSAS